MISAKKIFGFLICFLVVLFLVKAEDCISDKAAACVQSWRNGLPEYFYRDCNNRWYNVSGDPFLERRKTPATWQECPNCPCVVTNDSTSSFLNYSNFYLIATESNAPVNNASESENLLTLLPSASSGVVSNWDSVGCAVVQVGTNQTQIVSFGSNAVLSVGSFLGETQQIDWASEIQARQLAMSSQQLRNQINRLGNSTAISGLYLGNLEDGRTGGFENASSIWSNTFVYPYLGQGSNFEDAMYQGVSNSLGDVYGFGGIDSADQMYHGVLPDLTSAISSKLESNTAFEDGRPITDTDLARDQNLVIDFKPLIVSLETNQYFGRGIGSLGSTVQGKWKFNFDPLQFKGMRFLTLVIYFVAALFIFKWGIDQKLEVIEGWVKLSQILSLQPASSVGLDVIKDATFWLKKILQGGASMVFVATIFSFLSVVLDGMLVFRGMLPTSTALLGTSTTVTSSLGGSQIAPTIASGNSVWGSVLTLLFLMFPARTLFAVIFEVWALRVGIMANLQKWLNDLLRMLGNYL